MQLYFPMFALIFLFVVVSIMLAKARYKATVAREVKLKEIALSKDTWPDNVKKISNNFTNLFEMPVLFFVLCFIALNIEYTPTWFVICAWAFVAFRYLHSFIHCTSNIVKYRFYSFLASNAALFVMFFSLIIEVTSK
jgi:hypothetical protein